MFLVGDKIVYPMHGAGVIEAIERRNILGKSREYYVLRMPIGEMRVLVPVGAVPEAGLRPIVSKEVVAEVFSLLSEEPSEEQENWNRRYRTNMEKMKSGDIFDLAEVVRNMTRRDQLRGLSTTEKKLLDNARQLLVSELVLVEDLDPESVIHKVSDCLSA
ncbi:MAG: CarD family transcriptional regulator [Peptococcaceae bacterium]|nr:CarD family transcriptional regulator [Peptococcaceae bacterium]